MQNTTTQNELVNNAVIGNGVAIADAVAAMTVGLNDSVQLTTASNDEKKAVTVRERIAALVAERKVWEHGAFYKSNVELYALLGKCYALYAELSGSGNEAKEARAVLKEEYSKLGYKFSDSTHGLTKLVKYVFEGVDRRRVSAYSLVLREALAQNVKAADVAAFITKGGGVEEIRRSKSKNAKTPAQKAELGKQAVSGTQLAVVSSDKLAEKLNVENVGNDMVAIVTQQADGSLVVRALVNSKTVLKAALACAYSASKTDLQKDAANSEAANDDSAQDARIKEAAAS